MRKNQIDEANCPVKATIDIIGGKWKPIILYYLKDGHETLRGTAKTDTTRNQKNADSTTP